ncbi:MAG: 30S ribosomal protein S18 [Mollicutes bacterium PWAP]|nr:30S ribosomal protein S18 [Mollicutes bacterium PWAP]
MAFKKKQVRRKYNAFVPKSVKYIDYKDIETLSKFINNTGRIIPAAVSGLTAKQQRMISRAIKRAREMALLPYSRERIRV